jgi:cytochrome c biogenesis protein CcmG/thiol:disulfide interchange protein DsbE
MTRLARRLRPIPVTLAVAALALPGCGSSDGAGSGAAPPDYERALAGAPEPLAALYEQANELLPGGAEAYDKRIAALRGYPVVVNVWASWCGPCRFEFPHFQQAVARYGKRVAFLGVDKQDSDDLAAAFLREEPVPYPSYTDPDEEIAESVGDGGATGGLPATAFYDRDGEVVFLKLGPYSEEAELRADIERYALGRSVESG